MEDFLVDLIYFLKRIGKILLNVLNVIWEIIKGVAKALFWIAVVVWGPFYFVYLMWWNNRYEDDKAYCEKTNRSWYSNDHWEVNCWRRIDRIKERIERLNNRVVKIERGIEKRRADKMRIKESLKNTRWS